MPVYAVKLLIKAKAPVPREELTAHARMAVNSWGGQGDPDSPLWPSNLNVRATCLEGDIQWVAELEDFATFLQDK